MSEVVNLRLARKRKARERAEADAAHSRAIHGLAKLEKQAARVERESTRRKLDGHFIASPIAGSPDDER